MSRKPVFPSPSYCGRKSQRAATARLAGTCGLAAVSVSGISHCILILAISFSGCSKRAADVDPPPAEPVEVATAEPPAPPPPKPLELAALTPVTLDPGASATVELQVQRNGNEGPMEVSVADAPEGVTVKTGEIADGQSTGQLEVAAAQSLGDEPLAATLQVTVQKGDLKATQPLELNVNKLDEPILLPVSAVIL